MKTLHQARVKSWLMRGDGTVRDEGWMGHAFVTSVIRRADCASDKWVAVWIRVRGLDGCRGKADCFTPTAA